MLILCQSLHGIQAAMGRYLHSSTRCQTHVGSCGHVPLCQAPKAIASRGLGAGNAYPPLEAPERV
jgi:hypothetical protein